MGKYSTFRVVDERSAVDRFFSLFEEFINREQVIEDGEKALAIQE